MVEKDLYYYNQKYWGYHLPLCPTCSYAPGVIDGQVFLVKNWASFLKITAILENEYPSINIHLQNVNIMFYTNIRFPIFEKKVPVGFVRKNLKNEGHFIRYVYKILLPVFMYDFSKSNQFRIV